MAAMPVAINYTLLLTEELEELQRKAQQAEELARRLQALELQPGGCVMPPQVRQPGLVRRKAEIALRILEAGHIDPSSYSGLAILASILREARRSMSNARYPTRSFLLDLEAACRTEMRCLEGDLYKQSESLEV